GVPLAYFITHRRLDSDHSDRPGQHQNAKHNAIDGKGSKPALADIAHKPGDGSVGDDEGDDEADGEDDPLMRCDFGDADGVFIFAAERLEERVKRGHRHGGYGEEEGELEGGGARHSHQLSGGNRGHGARGAGENGGENLTGADPDGLAAVNVVHFPGMDGRTGHSRAGLFRGRFHGVDDPHDDAADQQGSAYYVEALEVLADHFGQ